MTSTHASRAPSALAVLALVSAPAACGGGPPPFTDGPPGDAPIDPVDADPLASLAGTGLCVDAGCTQISADVREYEPQFALYADGATKRRWISLPPGAKIDTSNMNHWVFPQGTRLWKEFSRDGVRVETRFMTKQRADDEAPGAWFYISYAWNTAQNATTAVAQGEADANGTPHDIPSRNQCRDCHESLLPGRVLGFQAIQLDHDAPPALLDLADLIAMDALSAPPPPPAPPAPAFPRFPLPGEDEDRAALGYLHANCGTCHNPNAPTHDETPLDLRLDTGKLGQLADTPTVQTTVGVTGKTIVDNGTTYTTLVIPRNAADSILIVRLNTANRAVVMPKLGTELVDPDGQAILRAWIDTL